MREGRSSMPGGTSREAHRRAWNVWKRCCRRSWLQTRPPASRRTRGHRACRMLAAPFRFPLSRSQTSRPLLPSISSDEMDKDAEELRELSQQVDAAKSLADKARLRGWTADCGGTPYCLEERATTLAGLARENNPHYPSEEGWGFGVSPPAGARLLRGTCGAGEAARLYGGGAYELCGAVCLL